MKIEGKHRIEASPEKVFAALTDPAVLQRCIPGCEQMQKSGDNQYSAKLTAGVGPIKGVFRATVSLQDITPPRHYKLIVEGKGQPGFLKGTGELNLTAEGQGTVIDYAGDVNVGGVLASVGQRMIQGAANMLSSKFFSTLETEMQGVQKPA